MTFTDSIKSCLNKYATFRGRAPRSEYWGFWAFCILTEIVAMIVFGLIGYLCGKGIGMLIAGYIGAFLASLMLFILPLLIYYKVDGYEKTFDFCCGFFCECSIVLWLQGKEYFWL